MKARMRKMFAAVFLALAIAVTQIPAADLSASNATNDFQTQGNILIKYTGTASTVSVPNGITEIGAEAFSGNRMITSVTLPASVEQIDTRAFYGCVSLEKISIPAKCTTIGMGAFATCSSLETVQIPASVTEIGESAFAGCKSLSTLEIHKDNKNYVCKDGILYNADSTEICQVLAGRESDTYTMPATVTDIQEYAFWGCTKIKNIGLSANLKTIPAYAFSNCKALESISIPFDVKRIEMKAFEDCRSLTDVYIPASVVDIHETAFDGCYKLNIIADEGTAAYEFFQNFDTSNSAIADYEEEEEEEEEERPATSGTQPTIPVEIPGGQGVIGTTRIVSNQAVVLIDNQKEQVITGSGSSLSDNESGQSESEKTLVTPMVDGSTIAERAFYQNSSLKEYQFPAGVTTIGDFAFARSGLQSVSIPAGVTHIGYGAFYHCEDLERVSVPHTVIEIEPAAFARTAYLENWKNGGDMNDFLVVGNGVLIAYKGNGSRVTIPENVKVIGAEVFQNHAEIYQVFLPDSLQSIGEDAFAGCTGLQVVSGGNNVTQIKDRAFLDCPIRTARVLVNTESVGLQAYGQKENQGATDSVIFLGDTLPTLSYEKTATRLSNSAYRDLAFSGIETAVINNTSSKLEGTILDPAFLGFRGVIVSIVKEATDFERGTANLVACTLEPDASTGVVTVPDEVMIFGRPYDIMGMDADTFAFYKTAADWCAYNLTRIDADNSLKTGVTDYFAGITFDESGGSRVSSLSENSAPVQVSVAADILDNEDKASAEFENNDDKYFLHIKEAGDDEEKLIAAVENAYGEIANRQLLTFDMQLYERTNQIPITRLGKESLMISLPVPIEMKNQQELCVVCLDSNNQLEVIYCQYVTHDNVLCIEFPVNHFSVYGIYGAGGELAEKIAVKNEYNSSGAGNLDDSPNTGDYFHPKWFAAIGLLCLAGVFLLKKDKRVVQKMS